MEQGVLYKPAHPFLFSHAMIENNLKTMHAGSEPCLSLTITF